MSLSPDSAPRRSPLYRQLQAAGAEFVVWADAAIAMHCDQDRSRDYDRIQHLGLIDLSVLPRIGFKGPGAPAWLTAQGLSPVGAPNRATRQVDGGLLVRLGAEEHLLLPPSDGGDATIRGLIETYDSEQPDGVYDLPRRDSHAWLRVTGIHAAKMFAKLCGVDLRPDAFAVQSVAQTQVARVSAIIIRADCGVVPAYHLLFDTASAVYVWDCLTDAAREFDGGPAGFAALLEQDAPGG